MAGPLESSRQISPTGAAAYPLSKTVDAVVGTTETVLTRPGDERILVIDVEVADFRIRPGDAKQKAVTFDETGGGVEDEVTSSSHGYATGDGPYHLTQSGTLPTGLAEDTDYWIIAVDTDTFQLASSLANAQAGTQVEFTGDGTPPNEIAGVPATPAATSTDGYNSLFLGVGRHVFSAPAKLTVVGSAGGSKLLYWWL